LFVLARFTPYEWESPHPCAPNQEELENIFNFQNCVWFCIGSLMQQGCDFLPKAVSTRLVASIWWFFTLIMISSYTANLAAFLTVDRMESPIGSAEDLASQSKIKYGLSEDGSTASFFRTSKISPYSKMWQVMSNDPKVFLGLLDGIRRVNGTDPHTDEDDHYAYFTESSTIEYLVERNCELAQVGGLLDNKGYGIALPPDSPWVSQLNQQLLHMQERGELAALKEKWWSHEDSSCLVAGGGIADELDLENVGGVFVCLMGGMAVATVIAVVEFIWHLRSQTSEHKSSVAKEMGRELRFILRCRGSTKPTRGSDLDKDGDSEGTGLVPLSDRAATKQAAALDGSSDPPAVTQC